jgi:hypothetical protein
MLKTNKNVIKGIVNGLTCTLVDLFWIDPADRIDYLNLRSSTPIGSICWLSKLPDVVLVEMFPANAIGCGWAPDCTLAPGRTPGKYVFPLRLEASHNSLKFLTPEGLKKNS